MRALTHKQIEKILKVIIAIAVIVLVVLCILLIQEYRQVRHNTYMGAHESFFAALHSHGPLNTSDASSIQTWMTFDYINHLFALPPQYLQTNLAITDARYPHLTIAEYAEDAQLAQSAFLAKVQAAIRAYSARMP